VSGSEDLVLQGRVEGTITLQNKLTVEPGASVAADVEADEATIQGELKGDIVAAHAVALAASARVTGNIRSPRVIIDDGAQFRGSVEMDVPLPEGVTVPRR
jgi:cytoskeletal protein CcmA (bactofilin family)